MPNRRRLLDRLGHHRLRRRLLVDLVDDHTVIPHAIAAGVRLIPTLSRIVRDGRRTLTSGGFGPRTPTTPGRDRRQPPAGRRLVRIGHITTTRSGVRA